MKKLIATLLTVTAMVTAPVVQAVDYGAELKNQPTTTYSQTFTDVSPNYWAFSYIGEMNVRGVLSGYPNGYFYPDNYVTRAEFAKIMTVASSLPLDYSGYNAYADVNQNDWFYPYVLTAQYYLCGYNMNGGTYYLPNTNALREDIAVALVKLKGYDTTGYDESILKAMFTDYQSISEYARPYVATALEKGLISGYEDNTFRGQNSITRAEAATLLWRAYQYGSGNKVTASMTPYVPDATVTPTQVPTPEPTAKPVEKPTVVEETPVPTAKPTEAPTPEPTEEPTPEPTETPVEYKWSIDTIYTGNISSVRSLPNNKLLIISNSMYTTIDIDGNIVSQCNVEDFTGNIPEGLATAISASKADKKSLSFICRDYIIDADGSIWLKLEYTQDNCNKTIWYNYVHDTTCTSKDEINIYNQYIINGIKYSYDWDQYKNKYVVKKWNLITSSWDEIDIDETQCQIDTLSEAGIFYVKENKIYVMDFNGDSTLLSDNYDIRIDDNKSLEFDGYWGVRSNNISDGIFIVNHQYNTIRALKPIK